MRGLILVLFFLGGMLLDSNTSGPVRAEIDASRLFKAHCLPCHGEDGKGTDLGKGLGTPDFTDVQWQAKEIDERFVQQILNGSEKMFAFKEKLNMDEIKALVAHVRKFASK